jgi:excinuclease UvrABC ATPase subunit
VLPVSNFDNSLIKVEMHFLADIYVSCDVCDGRRYNRETLEVFYKGKTIAQVLAMTVEAAVEFFEAIPKIKQKLQTLMDVGLSYITLGQNATKCISTLIKPSPLHASQRPPLTLKLNRPAL